MKTDWGEFIGGSAKQYENYTITKYSGRLTTLATTFMITTCPRRCGTQLFSRRL